MTPSKMSFSIPYRGTTKARAEICIRYPRRSDLNELLRYINALSRERTFITFQGEQVSRAEEEKYLKQALAKSRARTAVHLLVFSVKKLIAKGEITLGPRTHRHVGTLGISVAKKFRGQGVGSLLMRLLLTEAVRKLPSLEIVQMGVYAKNKVARKMYRRFGFHVYGTLPGGMKLGRGYDDDIYMYKRVRPRNPARYRSL